MATTNWILARSEKFCQSHIRLLIDAKYKSRIGLRRTRVIESDLCEALAFLEATKTNRIVLAYPRPADAFGEQSLGDVAEVERLHVAEREVIGVEVSLCASPEPSSMKRRRQF
jgi:hypothetical protein